jgi:hypothetical protein
LGKLKGLFYSLFTGGNKLMDNESVMGTSPKEGQTVKGPSERTSQTVPNQTEGQPEATATSSEKETTQKGTQTTETSEDLFMDADEDIKSNPALLKKYKDMQKAFTKKSESIKGNRQAIEAYKAFMKDPVNNLKALARQYGVNLTDQEVKGENKAWEPNSWDDVMEKATEIAEQRIMSKLGPVVKDVTTMRKNNIESFLDQNAEGWREYEDEMMATLKEHPSMVKDPLKLYRLSIPDDVWEARFTQKAIKKMQDKTKSSQVSGISTSKKTAETTMPDKKLSFDEAVEFARRQLADKGMTAPR